MGRRTWARVVLPVVAAVAGAPFFAGDVSGAAAAGELVGTFSVTAGSCDGAVAGSYFRMISPVGHVSNGDSPCSDDTYTPLAPGTDGGLVTGGYQPSPDPAFDGNGNGVANRITQPAPFFGVLFATSTEPVDPQTGTKTPAPSVSVDANGKLSGVLSSFGASWNRQSFNQGAPKPDGSYPGETTKVSGTYDATSGAFVLTWSSEIEGGPFDGFTGVWHLIGTFRSTGGGAAPAAGSAGGTIGGTAGQAPQGSSRRAAGGSTAGGDAAPDSPGSIGDEQASPGEAGALPEGAVTTSVTTSDDGFRPASWLVVVLGAAGIAGVLWLVWMTRSPTEPRP